MKNKYTTFSMIIAGVIEGCFQRDNRPLMELYQKTSITSPTWARLRRGQSKIDVEHLRSVEAAFGYKVSDIIKASELVQERIAEQDNVQTMPPKQTDKGRILKNETIAFIGFAALTFAAIAVLSRQN